MNALDGNFNSRKEVVTATLPAGAPEGNHTIFIRCKDSNNMWGDTRTLTYLLDKTQPTVNLYYKKGKC